MKLTDKQVNEFQKLIYTYFNRQGRKLPWRETKDPYAVVVSEVMLQQTQVDRVIPKYFSFIHSFPDFQSLSQASKGDVLREWQGLGYNRRGLYLKRLAEVVMDEFGGVLPQDLVQLVKLPGIGPATARSIAAFAFNLPVVFVETNIRSVYIHQFFAHDDMVTDVKILPLVEQTLDLKNPRRWYNALMDYGAMLKSKERNPSRRSAHYVKQSPFAGSVRQLRGQILRLLHENKTLSLSRFHKLLPDDRLHQTLRKLEQEGFLILKADIVRIA